jgi:DNA-binding transcriptional LysR family regulator
MDINTIRTFLELAATGNFSRVAERLHITQSTVSARIKVLEERINRQLFERTPSGVNLTPAGQRFHHYAVSIQQLWQQGQQDVALPQGFEGVVGVGIHLALCKRVFPQWISWMRKHHPAYGVHIETDYSERLTDMVSQGLLDLAVTHMPKVLPGLKVEKFMDDQLVMISRQPICLADVTNDQYIYVDWSYGYREEHREKLPQLHSSPFYIGFGEIAMSYLLENDGAAYLPLVDAAQYIQQQQLYIVKDSPPLSRPAFLIYPDSPLDKHHLDIAISGLKPCFEINS